MKWRVLKYMMAYILPISAFVAFKSEGWLAYAPVILSFVIVPLLDQLAGRDARNLEGAQRELARKDKWYDAVLYLTVPIQWITLFVFLSTLSSGETNTWTRLGHILSMGMMCGVYGINIGHELGHRTTLIEKLMAKAMLATSLYMHFYIEHNRGHHRNVGTPDDSATARRGENIYAFFIKVLPGSVRSAWNIVAKERRRSGMKVISPGNELIQYFALELALVVSVALFFGGSALVGFLGASLMGMLLLETVNYVEHYGLERKKVNERRYEDVQVWHSWNSDFIMGRLFLFELTRHSDHHYQPFKHYQLLESVPGSRELPAGYPAMMILSFIPPVWFKVVDPLLDESVHPQHGQESLA